MSFQQPILILDEDDADVIITQVIKIQQSMDKPELPVFSPGLAAISAAFSAAPTSRPSSFEIQADQSDAMPDLQQDDNSSGSEHTYSGNAHPLDFFPSQIPEADQNDFQKFCCKLAHEVAHSFPYESFAAEHGYNQRQINAGLIVSVILPLMRQNNRKFEALSRAASRIIQQWKPYHASESSNKPETTLQQSRDDKTSHTATTTVTPNMAPNLTSTPLKRVAEGVPTTTSRPNKSPKQNTESTQGQEHASPQQKDVPDASNATPRYRASVIPYSPDNDKPDPNRQVEEISYEALEAMPKRKTWKEMHQEMARKEHARAAERRLRANGSSSLFDN
ncbi:hypothetical protein FQN57_001680 [Myotisia sp. PD_48]|nr:hypothetical protein FQN57_001680 [Myotisia sp. PD_48]